MTRMRVIAGALVGLGVFAGASQAYGTSTASFGENERVINLYDSTGLSSDTANDVTVTPAGPHFVLSDPGGMDAAIDDECVEISPTTVNCPAAATYLGATLFGGN